MDGPVARTTLDRLLFERHIGRGELIARSGLARQTVYRAINGREVTLGTWIRLAEVLGVSVAEIAPPDVAQRISAVA